MEISGAPTAHAAYLVPRASCVVVWGFATHRAVSPTKNEAFAPFTPGTGTIVALVISYDSVE